MKKLCVLLLITIFVGCDKIEETPSDVTVKINISGFNITIDDFGTLKSVSADVFDNFQHKYASGVLHFTAPSGAAYSFNTDTVSIAGFVFSITPGTYQLAGIAGEPTGAGASVMPFSIPEQEIVIYDTTTVLNITITPLCALFLVADAQNLLESAVLYASEDAYGSYSTSPWSFYQDSLYYYTYFKPQNGFYAKLTKKDATILSMETGLLKVGYIYKIEVTDGAGKGGVNLNGDFEEGELIVW